MILSTLNIQTRLDWLSKSPRTDFWRYFGGLFLFFDGTPHFAHTYLATKHPYGIFTVGHENIIASFFMDTQ